jgi:hypothetical protein
MRDLPFSLKHTRPDTSAVGIEPDGSRIFLLSRDGFFSFLENREVRTVNIKLPPERPGAELRAIDQRCGHMSAWTPSRVLLLDLLPEPPGMGAERDGIQKHGRRSTCKQHLTVQSDIDRHAIARTRWSTLAPFATYGHSLRTYDWPSSLALVDRMLR